MCLVMFGLTIYYAKFEHLFFHLEKILWCTRFLFSRQRKSMSFCWLGYMSFFSECEISLNGTLLDSRLGHELIRSIQALLMWFYHDTPAVNPSALNLNLDGYINFWIQGSLDQKLAKIICFFIKYLNILSFSKGYFPTLRQFIRITTCIKLPT